MLEIRDLPSPTLAHHLKATCVSGAGHFLLPFGLLRHCGRVWPLLSPSGVASRLVLARSSDASSSGPHTKPCRYPSCFSHLYHRLFRTHFSLEPGCMWYS